MSQIKLLPEIRRGCETLVRICADLRPNETVLIISEELTSEIGDAISHIAREISSFITHRIIPPIKIHGQEPPSDISEEMLMSAVIFCFTRNSLAHSEARFNASEKGARFLSLPDYGWDVIKSEALKADFKGFTSISRKLSQLLTEGHQLAVKTRIGTDLISNISGRIANAAPGWCWGPGTLASPPDAEANIAVLEYDSDGTIIVDGSIPCPELGLLKAPLKLIIKGGYLTKIEGPQSGVLSDLFDRLGNSATRIVAEFGIGLNPLAKLRGSMLEDEGCLGTVHFGFGANSTIGGKNKISFHLDHIICDPTIYIDGKKIMSNGSIVKEIQNECH